MQVKLLVTDDCPIMRETLRSVFSSHGFRVLTARDGGEAVSVAVAEQPRVIVMDLEMPGVDGWTAIRQLRANAVTRLTPVIAFTSNVLTREDEADLLALGFTRYLWKFCSLDTLVQTVTALVQGA